MCLLRLVVSSSLELGQVFGHWVSVVLGWYLPHSDMEEEHSR